MKIQLSKCDPKNELTLGYSWLAAPLYPSLRGQSFGYGKTIPEALQEMEDRHENSHKFPPSYTWT